MRASRPWSPRLSRSDLLALRRLRQVDLDDVVRAARDEVLAQLGVDHVIRGRDHVLERADGLGVVAKGAQGLDVSHRPATLAGAGPGFASAPPRHNRELTAT